MGNAWNVIWWTAEGKKKQRAFEGELPREAGAIDFGKKLQSDGLKPVIVSRRKAFGPPLAKIKPPQRGMLWCPYCLKWCFFKEYSIRVDGLIGPMKWRCPVCTISIYDAYVKKYNPEMVERLDTRFQKKVPSTKILRNNINQGNLKSRRRRG